MGGLNFWTIKLNILIIIRTNLFRLVDLFKSAKFLVDGKLSKIIHTKDYYANNSLAENKTSDIVIIVLLRQSAYLDDLTKSSVSETERKLGILFLKIQSIFLKQFINIIAH